MPDMTVSVVIPTRNRAESLYRLLGAVARQERVPDEVIVVDASDRPLLHQTLLQACPGLKLEYAHTSPSVCAQRNLGLRRATGTHVWLCDDDIEPPPAYLRQLAAFLSNAPVEGAATGIWLERDATGAFPDGLPVPSFRHMLLNFMAQRSLWGDVEGARGTWLTAAPLRGLKAWYRHRGNTWSLAGWPLLTQVRGRVVRTAIYSLGAALVRRDWLTASLFDERLGPHGIGDNYGVALGFPRDLPIAILTDVRLRHHRSTDNRLDVATAHRERALALHYFLRTHPRFRTLNRLFLIWSLLRNTLQFAVQNQRDLFRATVTALRQILTGRNPLLQDAALPGQSLNDRRHQP